MLRSSGGNPQVLLRASRRLASSVYSSQQLPDEVDFAHFERCRRAGQTLIVDVREPAELEKNGRVPGVVNVPLGLVSEALVEASAEDFELAYGAAKPDKGDQVVTMCAIGKRSAKAAEVLKAAGFTNVANYRGSYNDWHENTEKLH